MADDSTINLLKDSSEQIETPFEGDLWNRQNLANRLENYISRITIGATIAIDAEWGAGKSWFVRHWQAQLKNNDFKVIYLNAFAQDYIDDPFLTISMEINNCLNQDKTIAESLKDTIANAYRAILPNVPMLLWSLTSTLMGAGLFSQAVKNTIEDIQKNSGDIGEEAAELLNEKLKEHISGQIENYENEKQSLEYFKQQLAAITEKQDKPLVFIVDELDRCKPEFAIRLIERIKHFFDIPKVVFVLAVNKSQLEQAINSFYGFSDSVNYLEKFIDLTVLLKMGESNKINYEKAVEQHLKQLGFTHVSNDEKEQLTHLCNVYKPNSRQMIRIFNKFSILYFGLDENKTVFLFLILIYVELKIISEFTEDSLINNFIDRHEVFFNKDYKKVKTQYQNRSPINNYYSFIKYLNGYIYRSNGLEYFTLYLDDKKEKIHLKNNYYPSKTTSGDLILAWYDYIHIVFDE